MIGYILDYMLHTIRSTAYDATIKSHDKLSLVDLMVIPPPPSCVS
jgi:hypothetical protein